MVKWGTVSMSHYIFQCSQLPNKTSVRLQRMMTSPIRFSVLHKFKSRSHKFQIHWVRSLSYLQQLTYIVTIEYRLHLSVQYISWSKRYDALFFIALTFQEEVINGMSLVYYNIATLLLTNTMKSIFWAYPNVVKSVLTDSSEFCHYYLFKLQ